MAVTPQHTQLLHPVTAPIPHEDVRLRSAPLYILVLIMLGRINRPRMRAAASIMTPLACATIIISDMVLASITPAYNAAAETSSQLMSPGEPYANIARVTLGFYAVLNIPFALLLPGRLDSRTTLSILTATALWTHIVAALISALARNDASSSIAGLNANDVHDLAAKIMFASAWAVLAGAAIARTSPKRINVASLTVTALLISALTVDAWPGVYGLLERVAAVAFFAWISSAAWCWRGEGSAR